MVTASAPGKVILFGEHAVVYGEPSLVAALDRRTYVEANSREDNKINISSVLGDNASLGNDLSWDMKDDFRYVKKAVSLVFERINNSTGLDILIKSDVPPSSGLGSSAAVTVATIMAVSEIVGLKIDKKEIADMGHKVELEVQGAASPTDTSISTFGGVLLVKPAEKEVEHLEAELPLTIGYTGVERSTKALVDKVRRQKDDNPDLVDPIIKHMGRLTREAKVLIEAGESIGELMNINHGLLESLDVSTKQLSQAVNAARKAGAKGAKLTGAGGGGCMVALTPQNQAEVMKAIQGCDCEAFSASISKEGVRLEEP